MSRFIIKYQGPHIDEQVAFRFMRQRPRVDIDRFVPAMGVLMPSLSALAGPNSGGTLAVGNQTLPVTAAEAATIDLCRNLIGYPDLVMKTLDTVPGLKSKLNGMGGIDAVVGASGGTSNPTKNPVSQHALTAE